jgi:dynein heavy chain, axonemal
MLYTFVIQEMPELQKKKDQIVKDNAQSAKKLRDIEEEILGTLTAKSDTILETDDLIVVLDVSKITTDEISVRMKESVITEQEIDTTREKFRPVAFRAQILFFTIVDLAEIDPMYQYSLQWFTALFVSSVDNSTKHSDPDQRIQTLNDHFTQSLYDNICRSLFERHKLLFSFKMTVNIMFGDETMDADELRFFLAGPSGEIKMVNNPTDWLGDLEWTDVCKQLVAMSDSLPPLKGMDEYFFKNHKEFQKIFDSLDPEKEKLPGDWEDKLTHFQKMIVLKSIRSDKITPAVQDFVIA